MELKLTNCNEVALIDEEDYERLKGLSWRKIKTGYVAHNGPYKPKKKSRDLVYLHREVMRAEKGKSVDHKNRDKLDNRKENLRFATQLQNCANRAAKNKYGYKGITKDGKTWTVNLTKNAVAYSKTGIESAEEAARIYNELAIHHHGEFAVLNDV